MSTLGPSKPSSYPPSKTALLFLDYQNVLVNMTQDSETKQKAYQVSQDTPSEGTRIQRRHCALSRKHDHRHTRHK
ncbi:hypothetical protein F4813DRAFT_362591 [Daldinia decipiens]|uniref:uncharacterized protein n=1 Tax=Daldinia decipiens TaxID=326647 RepID=UPI0020C27145|nr:uncharacterized protein F4813DRAFT_362591 [Daldinia decipiens]KAI1656994.1 hypothetical protein F4813DRAFT_362591 [Daldinia decipiens]